MEQVVQGTLVLFPLDDDPAPDTLIMLSERERALEAVERLTTRFAHIAVPNLDQHLHDPMMALANADSERPFYE